LSSILKYTFTAVSKQNASLTENRVIQHVQDFLLEEDGMQLLGGHEAVLVDGFDRVEFHHVDPLAQHDFPIETAPDHGRISNESIERVVHCDIAPRIFSTHSLSDNGSDTLKPCGSPDNRTIETSLCERICTRVDTLSGMR
jgi:hypothetical protein